MDQHAQKLEDDIFLPYTRGFEALNRLLFLRCVQSVKLYVWLPGERNPRSYFSIEIENLRQTAGQDASIPRGIQEDRGAIIRWLKSGMERHREPAGSALDHQEQSKRTFFKFFESVARRSSQSEPAPRCLIPLTIRTKRWDFKAKDWVFAKDHVLISTGFGSDEDVRWAARKEVQKCQQCLVPYVAVAAHIAHDGSPVDAADRDGSSVTEG